MNTQNDTGEDHQARGFASLSSLLTDSEELHQSDSAPAGASAESKDRGARAPTSAVAPTQHVAPSHATAAVTRPEASSTTPSAQAKPDSTQYAWLWLIPIGIVFVIWLANGMSSSPPSNTEQPQTYAESTPAQPTVETPPVAAETNVNAAYGTAPPVGSNLVLDEAQIRYCIAQSIRLEGAQEMAGFDSDEKVTLFNGLIADYNSRCSSYRYRRGVREQAAAAVEPYRHALRVEGLRLISDFGQEVPDDRPVMKDRGTTRAGLFDGVDVSKTKGIFDGVDTSQSTGSLERQASSQQQAPNTRLDALDDECEAANARGGEEAYQACLAQNRSAGASKAGNAGKAVPLSALERSSLESACSVDKDLHGPAAYRACVQKQESASARAPHRPDLSRLSELERQSLESACSVDKDLHGPGAYNTCLQTKLNAWARAPRRPDLSRLSAAERDSLESSCSVDKDLHGPAAYNSCLQTKLNAWARAPRRPDLSRLSTLERDSMESACSVDKDLHGPAAYNTCLSQQLRKL